MRDKQQWHRLTMLLLFFITVGLLDYFMTNHGIVKSDYPFHYDRMLELHHDIVTGQLPLIRQSYGALQGGAVMAFYPWLTILPFTLLTFVVHSPLVLLRIITLIIVFGWSIVGYFSSESYFKSKDKALYFAILYASSVESVQCEQGDMGTALALIFLPLVFFGFLHLKNEGNWKMLTVGMTLLIYSHVVTSIITIVFIFVLFLFNIRTFKDKFALTILAGSITVLTTVFFWLPILWFEFQTKIASPVTPHSFTYYGIDFFPALIIIIVPSLMIIALLHRFSLFDYEILGMAVLCGAIMIPFIARDTIKILPFLHFIQFSDRFMPILAVFSSYLVTKYMFRSSERPISQLAKVVVACSLFLIPVIVSGRSMIAVDIHKTDKLYLSHHSFVHYMYHMPLSWGYDYVPSRASKRLQHHFSYQNVKISHYGTTLNMSKKTRNTLVPIVVYNGLRYQFDFDNKPIIKSQINWNKAKRDKVLVLKEVPRGKHLIRIKAVHV